MFLYLLPSVALANFTGYTFMIFFSLFKCRRTKNKYNIKSILTRAKSLLQLIGFKDKRVLILEFRKIIWAPHVLYWKTGISSKRCQLKSSILWTFFAPNNAELLKKSQKLRKSQNFYVSRSVKLYSKT